MNHQQVIDEARPMLIEVLGQIGLHRVGAPLDLEALRDPFSVWAQAQDVGDADFAFFVSLVGAFISEYLVDMHAAAVYSDGQTIRVRIPFEQGVAREFDPYAAASGLVRSKQSLSNFFDNVRG